MTTFRAFVSEPRDGADHREVRELSLDDLPDGELLVRVDASSVNYKDGLAASANGRVAQASPLVCGIDLAGEVVESASPAFAPGDAVVAHGYGIGVDRHGGYAAYARVPAGWALPLPAGLTTVDAMAIGTAGFAAGHSVVALEEHGLRPGDGPVLVTGAAGGVGSCAVAMLAGLGHEVVASTGRPEEDDWLRELGAAEVVGRLEATPKPLAREHWAAAVDCVGGTTLAEVPKALRYGGAVAASGLAGGTGLESTVFPFILRNVALLGIDTVQTPMDRRRAVWDRLAGDLRPVAMDALAREIGLDELDATLTAILRGQVRGRVVVRPG